MPSPRCTIIAGPNGAGKTTFAREFLPREGATAAFLNADLIAQGLSPLRPEHAMVRAGKLFLEEIDRLASQRVDFAFETTLSGRVYAKRILRWKDSGYYIQVVFLRLRSPSLAIRRVAQRVREGGHTVPSDVSIRRFHLGWRTFRAIFQPLADAWAIYDNSGRVPRLLETGP